MSRTRQRPYGVQLFDDIHNYLPDLLYNPEQFNSVREVLEYIRLSARQNFNLFDRHHREYITTTMEDNEEDTSESEEELEQFPRQSRHPQQSFQPNENNLNRLLRNILNTTLQRNTTVRRQAPLDNISNIMYSMFTTTMVEPINTTEMEPVIIRPTAAQIEQATQCLTTTHTADICSICQESMAHSDIRRINYCHHSFHMICIDRWFEQNVRCPVCRHDIRD
jgi:hypothetical protein